MFNWLRRLFSNKPYRIAQPWETPAEIREKLQCAMVGIDPASIRESKNSNEGKPMAPINENGATKVS